MQGRGSLARARHTAPAREQPGEQQSIVTVTRVRHSPVIPRQVHGDKAGPRSSWEVKLQVRDRVQLQISSPWPDGGWAARQWVL